MLFLVPPRTAGVAFTTRPGGSSTGAYHGLNLGPATGDDLQRVRANRLMVARALGIPERWGELKQVHGGSVHRLARSSGSPEPAAPPGDALLVGDAGAPVAVFTADCLPVALVAADMAGVAHAGWRGLCAGILGSAASEFAADQPVRAWIGPSIGPCHYQVGAEVVDEFRAAYPKAPEFWVPDGDRFRFDLRGAARWILRNHGVEVDDDDPPCTWCDDRFYSYRRDGGVTGRQAVVVWR